MRPLDPDMFDPSCPNSAMPIRIGDKWSAAVIRCLEEGPRRFSEIRVPLRGVTPKVLTQTLRALERDGMVTRTIYAEVPPRVEYELTPLGRTLLKVIAACRQWADEHMTALLAARAAYESRGEAER
ncbi:HxlR family transcriptional regulator [Allonocardiopsis opalescens]|uniref:HxlR family transcriptional regulator n=2 Tax=Allonocardiopsis opalescens TaxID=1144618 RepID=A0A2T0QDK6_9ACTN|nr:helix-turn-helix domain-containing protein [Allonocardiopsis opalescens]PRY02017.1 HxlR family transcriptional regulator [Allonocardiopsis opalescens]